jgi:magnesium-transporting ATPase (P-type)
MQSKKAEESMPTYISLLITFSQQPGGGHDYFFGYTLKFGTSILTAIMLLWINLVTDGLPALALSKDSYPRGIMKMPPRNPKEGIMNKSMVFSVIYVAIVITAGALYLLFGRVGNMLCLKTVRGRFTSRLWFLQDWLLWSLQVICCEI